MHEEPELITYFGTYRSTWTVFFFPLIDRLVCTIQNNQTLDAFMKYVAKYHILKSGQIEICLSEHIVKLICTVFTL